MTTKPEPVYVTLALTKTQLDELMAELADGSNARWRLNKVLDSMGYGPDAKAKRGVDKRAERVREMVDNAWREAYWAEKKAAQS